MAEIEALVAERARELAAPAAAHEHADIDVAEVAGEGAVDAPLMPHQPSWSAYLPACRTVLPTFPERNGLYGRLLRQR